MKKIISILILSIFIYNTFGFLTTQPFLSMYYKYLGMQGADMPSEKEMIVLLIFNKEYIQKGKIDFRWIHSSEFKYNGDMYDIVRKKETDKKLIIYCINDTNEKKLEEEYARRVDENTTNKKQRPNDNNPIKYIVSEPVCYLTFNPMNAMHSRYKSYNDEIFNNNIEDVLTPPPKFLSTI